MLPWRSGLEARVQVAFVESGHWGADYCFGEVGARLDTWPGDFAALETGMGGCYNFGSGSGEVECGVDAGEALADELARVEGTC